VENQQNSRAGRFFLWMESKAVSVIAAFPKRPLQLSPGAAGELSNKSIDSVVAKAPEPAPTLAAAAAAATEAAKKDIKGGYWFSVFGGRLADAPTASASGNPSIKALYRFLLISGLASTLIAVGAGVVHDLKSRTQALNGRTVFRHIGARGEADRGDREQCRKPVMPKDRGRVS
jgi:hypothetical protein